MKHRSLLIGLMALFILPVLLVYGQQPPADEFVEGELLLTTQAGVLLSKVQEMATIVDAEVQPIGVPDTYLLRLRNRAADQLKVETLNAVESLKSRSEIRWIRPNMLRRLHDTNPNDPLYGQQWAMPMMNMPKAWDIQKGQDTVKVAVIDTDFYTGHEDLQGRFDLNLSRDFRTIPPGNDINPSPGQRWSHGTNTSSCIIANANNGKGIAGLCWEKVQVVGLAQGLALDYAGLFASYQYVIDNATQIDVVNMSYGGYRLDNQEQDLLRQIHDRGVVLVASAGNDAIDTRQFPLYPSSFPFVISVSALGPSKTLASYSSYGKVELTAPGGDILTSQSQGILVCEPDGGYGFTQGTSFSAPYVAAAAAMVLSHGVPPGQVQTLLQDTADPLGKSKPSPEYGYGLINVYGALRGAGVFIVIQEPADGSVFEVLKARIRATISRADPDSIQLKIDDTIVPDSEWRSFLKQDPVNENVLRLDMVRKFTPGSHQIEISAASSEDETITGSSETSFLIQPHRVFGGLNLFSIPYLVAGTWEDLFGIDFALARWIPDPANPPSGAYARYFGSGEKDPMASPNPPDADVHPDGQNTPTPPRGYGYFLSLPTDTFVQPEDPIDLNTAYVIPLKPGWNMVGNPFPFAVDWNACEVEISGVGGLRQRIALQDAVTQEYVRGQIYRYVPVVNDYSWQTAPLGQFRPWTGHWVRALKYCNLIVPPLPSAVRSAGDNSQNPNTSVGGWTMQLTAKSGERQDTSFFGVNPAAQDTLSREDVEKPPSWHSFVSVRLLHQKGRAVLAQDLRRSERKAQTWDVEIETDQPNKEVTLQWSQTAPLPKGTRLTLEDKLTGNRVLMTSQSSYTFRTDERGATRRFRIVAQPAQWGRLMIRNVQVGANRGSGASVSYTLTDGAANVQVSVLNATGKPVARLNQGSRAAGAHTATWNGRSNDGVALPAGMYQLQITATSEEGEVARHTAPLVLVR